jgi:hypothetical protein
MKKEENARHEDVRDDVIVAYQEVMNKLKIMKGGVRDEEDELHDFSHEHEEDEPVVNHHAYQPVQAPVVEDKPIDETVIDLASRETSDSISRDLTEFKLNMVKALDDIRNKFIAEQEKFDLLKQAREEIDKDLENAYNCKRTLGTLAALMVAKNEKAVAMEEELRELKQKNDNAVLLMENERMREQREFVQKRDAMRKSDQEQYETRKRELMADLEASRIAFDEDCEIRRAKLDAREEEHEKWKQRQAKIIADEHEMKRLKERETTFPAELEAAVKKAEKAITEQLTRKYNYDLKVSEISWTSEKNLLSQKIDALQHQIEQYRALKEMYDE